MTNTLTPLDPDDTRPVSQQIADVLRGAIRQGVLAPGDPVPSATVLAEHYDTARNTAVAALKLLRTEGLTTMQPGRGTYVREGAAEAAAGDADLAARVAALEARVEELERHIHRS